MSCGPSGWVFDQSLFPVTAVTDFVMVCGDDWKRSTAQSLYMFGMLVGSFAFGSFADHAGRRAALVTAAAMLAIAGTVCALLPANPTVFPAFAAMRFVDAEPCTEKSS